MGMRAIDLIVIHHSASPLHTTVEEITTWHKARDFQTIGYHFVVLEDGTVAKGRDINSIGAHATGHNLRSIGICVVGDNTRPEMRWTNVQVHCLRALVQTLHILWPDTRVCGHRDLAGAATVCPGLDVGAMLAKRGDDSWTVLKSQES